MLWKLWSVVANAFTTVDASADTRDVATMKENCSVYEHEWIESCVLDCSGSV
jgi:hypothetical protein